MIEKTVDGYVVALLASEVSGADAELFSVDVDASKAVDQALSDIVSEDDRFASTEDLVTAGIAAVLGANPRSSREVQSLGTCSQHLDAIVANEQYGFSARKDVVEAAIGWYVDAESDSFPD